MAKLAMSRQASSSSSSSDERQKPAPPPPPAPALSTIFTPSCRYLLNSSYIEIN